MFIVGMPRSGTKLLRGLLDQHPRIRILQTETEFLPFLSAWVDERGRPQTALAFERLYEALRGATYFNYRAAGRPAFDWREWRARCAACDVGGLFEGFARYELDLLPGNDIIWADKSPAYIRCVPLLLTRFPGARVVHIVRDVRDYCVSSRRAWGKDIRRAAFRWGQDVLRAHHDCVGERATDPHRCIEVKYEELLQNPEAQMRRLSTFLGIDYRPDLIDLQQSVERRGHAAGRTGIVQDNFHKFEKYLTPREIAAVESLAWPAMAALGYEPKYAHGPKQLGPLTEQVLRLKDGVQLLLKDAKQRGVAGAIRFHTSHQRMTAKS